MASEKRIYANVLRQKIFKRDRILFLIKLPGDTRTNGKIINDSLLNISNLPLLKSSV
jgi:hypothetical protein